MERPHVHKIVEWVMPICRKYEKWLLEQGRDEEAWRLHETVKEMDKQWFYDWYDVPACARRACQQNWTNAFMTLVQELGYPNLLTENLYANNL